MNESIITFEGLIFHPFTEGDIDELSPIMKASFDEDTKIHTNKNDGGPEGYNNGGFMRKWYLNEGATSFKITKDGKPIGGLALWINENNINYLGNVFIDPHLQNKGIGSVVWRFVEHAYPNTIKWLTDTPAFSRRNHHFYVNKCGFKIVRIENPRNLDETCAYFMEKEMYAASKVAESPYSHVNPIRVIDSVDLIEQPTVYTCGQACIAMLAGVSVEEVCNVMKNDKSTTYDNLVYALDYYGFHHRLRRDMPKKLPDICLLRVQMPVYSHSVLYYKGTFFDPEFGIMNKSHPDGKIDSVFIEVYQ